jgi:hypothetical protein
MSQSAFSMNQPGLRKVTGRPISCSDCSISVRWLSRFSCGASAPMVDKQTTLPGRASAKAAVTAAMTRLASGKPGSGSTSDEGRMKTASAPEKAAVSAAASAISATATSQPRANQARALGGVADDGANRQACGEQRGDERPADFSSNSSDGEHDFLR